MKIKKRVLYVWLFGSLLLGHASAQRTGTVSIIPGAEGYDFDAAVWVSVDSPSVDIWSTDLQSLTVANGYIKDEGAVPLSSIKTFDHTGETQKTVTGQIGHVYTFLSTNDTPVAIQIILIQEGQQVRFNYIYSYVGTVATKAEKASGRCAGRLEFDGKNTFRYISTDIAGAADMSLTVFSLNGKSVKTVRLLSSGKLSAWRIQQPVSGVCAVILISKATPWKSSVRRLLMLKSD